jgi:hypothetical protein
MDCYDSSADLVESRTLQRLPCPVIGFDDHWHSAEDMTEECQSIGCPNIGSADAQQKHSICRLAHSNTNGFERRFF